MAPDDRNSGVEFLMSEPDDGPDEELVPPVGFPRLRRARLPLLVAGGVALIALVVANVVAGAESTPSAGPATVTVSPKPSATASHSDTSSGAAAQHGTIRLHVPGNQVSCAAQASCEVMSYTPHGVAAAVHHALPTARRLMTVTSTEHQDAPGSHLLARHISARVGKARLAIEIRPAGAHDVLGWNASETAARTLVTVRDDVAGQLVSLRLVGAPGYHLDLDAARALATDRRLASVRG